MTTTGLRKQLHGTPDTMVMRAHISGVGVFLLLWLVATYFPGLIDGLLALPAARIAELFIGGTLDASNGRIFIYHPAIEIEITRDCSGFSFFSLLVSLAIGSMVYFRRRITDPTALVILLATYPACLLTNAARMTCAVHARLFTAGEIPDSFQASLHTTVGALVFLPALLGFWILALKTYERNSDSSNDPADSS